MPSGEVSVRVVQLGMAVRAQQFALVGLAEDDAPSAIGKCSEVVRELLARRFSLMEFISFKGAAIPADLAARDLTTNELQIPSSPPTLLRQVRLVPVVCVLVLALAGTEATLPP